MFLIRRTLLLRPLRVSKFKWLICIILFSFAHIQTYASPDEYSHPWEEYSAAIEQRPSQRRLRLPTVETIMELEAAFIDFMDDEFTRLYGKNRKLFLADIRRGLVGVYRDTDGSIKSYRSLYDEKLYSSYSPEAAVATAEIKDNPAVRTHERITARALVSDSEPRKRLVFGKYTSGIKRQTAKAQDLECAVIFLDIPIAANEGIELKDFSQSLARYIASIQINDGQRLLALTLDEDNSISSGQYAPRVSGFKNFMPNPDYLKTWLQAKYVTADAAHWKLAMYSSTLQFSMSLILTYLFVPEKFHLVPAIANGLFALIICSHSKTYERIVASRNFMWESFKRLSIAMPMGLAVAGINHPDHLSVLTAGYVWYQLTVLNYGDRVLSTIMGRIPRWRDSVGMNAGTFKISIGNKTIDTNLPGDSAEREIPAIIRNIPKFIGMLLVSQESLIPSGTIIMLSLIPPAVLINYSWVKNNSSEHPKLAGEHRNYLRQMDVTKMVRSKSAALLNRANEAAVAITFAANYPISFSRRAYTSLKRGCQVLLASLR